MENKETLEKEKFTLMDKELIKEAKKVWKELSPNPIEMALFGAKWQQEQDKNKYSEEDMIKALCMKKDGVSVDSIIEKFKKK